MTSRQTQRRLYDELLTRYGVQIADAFMEAVADLKARADLSRIIKAIEQGNLDAALDALNLDPAAYGDVLDQIGQAYMEGGKLEVSGLPAIRDYTGAKLIIRFDRRNVRAENTIRQHGASLVAGIMDDERVNLRQALARGLIKGANPTATALDLVGRKNRVTGERVGGLIGLGSERTAWAEGYERALKDGDPTVLRRMLVEDRKEQTYRLRDRRFDGAIRAAVRAGKPIPADLRATMVTAYRSRALKARGDLIGLNETFNALAEAKEETYRQLIERGTVTAGQVTKGWKHLPSENPRVQHIAMNGRKVGIDELFILPDGTAMRFPHDPRAPVRHLAGCKCQGDYTIDFLGGQR